MRNVLPPVLALILLSCWCSVGLADEEEDFNQAEELSKLATKTGQWKWAMAAWKVYKAKHSDAPGVVKANLYLSIGAYQAKDWVACYSEAEIGLKSEWLTPAEERQLRYWAGLARLENAHSKAQGGHKTDADEHAKEAQGHFVALKKSFAGKDETIEASIHLAVALDLLGQPEEAIRELTAWLQKHSSHEKAADARYLLARNLIRANKMAEGINTLSDYLKTRSGTHTADAYFMRATARIQLKQYDEALLDLDEVIKTDHPHRFQAFYEKGLVRTERKELKAALECFRKALEGKLASSVVPDCRYRIAWLLYQDKRLEECIQECESFLRDSPVATYRDKALELQAKSCEQLKQWSQAKLAWERLAAFKTDARSKALVRAGEAARRGKEAGAANYYSTVLKEAPASESAARAEIGLGHIHLEKKEIQQAEAAFRRAVLLQQKREIDAEAGYWLGECYLQQHKYKEAARQFQAVAEKATGLPEAPYAWFKAGTAFDRDGQKEAADRCYRILLDLYPAHETTKKAREWLAETK